MGRLVGRAKSAPAQAPSSLLPKRTPGPYAARHVPGKKDNEWEVRDDAGVFVVEVCGSDFEVAKRRCEVVAERMNQAYQRGRASR